MDGALIQFIWKIVFQNDFRSSTIVVVVIVVVVVVVVVVVLFHVAVLVRLHMHSYRYRLSNGRSNYFDCQAI